MRFNRVDPDNDVDLVITTLDSYQPHNTDRNGTVNTNDGRINLKLGTSTTFRFSFVQTGTTTPITVDEADIGLYDIDGVPNGNVQEKLILYTTADYTIANTSPLNISTFSDRVEFTAPAFPIANVNDSTMLDATQERHSINFRFNNISEFELGYQVINGSANDGRNFFFAGDVFAMV